MDWLIYFFKYQYTPWIIAAVLSGVSLIVGIRWWRIVNQLDVESKDVRSNAGIDDELLQKDESTRWHIYTSEKFESAKVHLLSLSGSNTLARQTREFLNRCQPVEEDGMAQMRLETAATPSTALKLSEHLLDKNVHVSLYRAFPNYLVGIGLCITFLGLAVVIGNASAVITTGNSADTSNQALHDLLVAASSKFWSSLTAVLLSIAYGMWFRHGIQRMERAVGLLCRDLGRCVRIVKLDELQYESLHIMRKSADDQASMANKIGLLQGALDSTRENSAEQHRVLLEKLGAVADGLVGKLGQLGDDLGTKIGSMGNQVAGSLSQINEQAFANIAKQMTESLHKATEVHLKTIAERLETVSSMLAKLPDEFQALVGLVQENTTSIAAAFATAVKPIEHSLAAASSSAQEVATKFATLPEALEPARLAAKDLTNAASTISEMVGRIYSQNDAVVKRWEELSALIQSLDTHLADAIMRVGAVFPDYANKLQEFSTKWEDAMVKALSGLATNIKELSGSHEELRTQRSVWHESAEAVAKSLEAVNDHVVRFTDALATYHSASIITTNHDANASSPDADKISTEAFTASKAAASLDINDPGTGEQGTATAEALPSKQAL